MKPRLLALFAGVILVGCGPDGRKPVPGEFGAFVGTVKTEWVEDSSEMKLLEDFAYIGPDQVEWKAPKGSSIDGASIPQFLWTVIGSPYTGLYRRASVTHDIACQKRDRPSDDVHLMFYWACRCGGCSETEAKTLYAGVLLGGPKWSTTGAPVPVARSTRLIDDDFEDAKVDIETTNPSLEEIKMKARTRSFPKRPPEFRPTRPANVPFRPIDLHGGRKIPMLPTTRPR
jgi:hypothetical protein